MNLYDKASLILTPNAYKASKLYALKPTNGSGDFTFSRASAQTRRNANGLIESLGNNIPALEYPVGVSCPMWSFPVQRTNEIRNNSMSGAVAGNPGTLPTNWVISGLNREVIGIGFENGLPYVDLRLFGTATGAALQIQFEGNNVIAASIGQSWTASVSVRLLAAPAPPTNYNIRFREATSAGTFVADGMVAFSPNATLQRVIGTRANTGGTTERIQPMLQIGQVNGLTYDYTLRIAAPQMELGAYASPEIFTNGSSVTRVLADPNTSGLTSVIGQTSGSWYTEFRTGSFLPSAGDILGFSQATSNNVAFLISGGALRAYIYFGGSFLFVPGPTLVANTTYKIAFRYHSGSIALYVNGTAYTSSATFSFTGALTGMFFLNGNILGDRPPFLFGTNILFPVLTNAELQALTT